MAAAGAGAVVDADAVEGRGENENPELAGLVAVLELEPKEKLDVVVAAGVLLDTVDTGLPKLKLGREVDCGALVADAALDDAPLVAGLSGVALLLKLLVVAVFAADEEPLTLSIPSRCLRYCSRNDSMSFVRSPKGSASSRSLIFWDSVVCSEMLRPRSLRSFSFSSDEVEPLVEVDEDAAAAVGAEDMPPRMPETMVDVFDGTVAAFEVDGADESAGAPKENDGVEVVDAVLAAGAAAGLAVPKPVNPPKGFAFAGGCEAAAELELGVVVDAAPKLNVGVEVGAAGAAVEEALPNPVLPPRLAKGLDPPVDAPKGDDDAAAPNVSGLAGGAAGAGAAPGVPGVEGAPRRLGNPRMTLPAAGVAGIEPVCDGDSSSDASSPSSLRICLSA